MATEVMGREQPAEPLLKRRRATVEEFWALPESVLPTEYVNGEIIMPPTPTVLHQAVLGNLYYVLRTFVERVGLGRVFTSPLDVVLPTGDVVQPDIFLLTPKQTEKALGAKRVEAVPLFLIEILSPGSVKHDTMTKRALYEKCGVREYWIVDARERSITQLVLRKKHFVVTELGEGDTVKGVVLAGFEANVGELIGS
ncbi:MAG TPA: Uma2 family endonuclease [Pyrinomonadaceae bacterium]|jgi:Uma2 family endonuclease|nr:Uma2 family endonuclease [Pyrinomonadaceae bacterium]